MEISQCLYTNKQPNEIGKVRILAKERTTLIRFNKQIYRKYFVCLSVTALLYRKMERIPKILRYFISISRKFAVRADETSHNHRSSV